MLITQKYLVHIIFQGDFFVLSLEQNLRKNNLLISFLAAKRIYVRRLQAILKNFFERGYGQFEADFLRKSAYNLKGLSDVKIMAFKCL